MDEDDEVWVRTHARFNRDPQERRDADQYLKPEHFEAIIDIMERATGVAPMFVTQSQVERAAAERLRDHWPLPIVQKYIPELYHYWLKKRENLGKPLCRRYWPATSASDNNPYHVFRTRDKERYRLRKQARKNDVDSFRKMQQIRADLGRAQVSDVGRPGMDAMEWVKRATRRAPL